MRGCGGTRLRVAALSSTHRYRLSYAIAPLSACAAGLRPWRDGRNVDGADRGAASTSAPRSEAVRSAPLGHATPRIGPEPPREPEGFDGRSHPAWTGRIRHPLWGKLKSWLPSPDVVRQALRGAARAVRRPPAAVARRLRRFTHAQGAGESGLGKLIELHAVNSAGDMLITVALASTIFFSVPTDEARGRVALYLAGHHGAVRPPRPRHRPAAGPRAARPAGRDGRRRCSPARCSRWRCRGRWPRAAWSCIRPRWRCWSPRRRTAWCAAPSCRGCCRRAFSLVKANSRVTLAGLLATGVAAPIGAGLQSDRLGVAAVRGVRDLRRWARSCPSPCRTRSTRPRASTRRSWLPARSRRGRSHGRRQRSRRRHGSGGPDCGRSAVRTHALRANAALRCLSGFLIFFLAFLLREHPLSGQSAARLAGHGGRRGGRAATRWARRSAHG